MSEENETVEAANACIARSPTGKPGHPYGPVKSWERKRDIARDMLSGMKTKEVALKHDLSTSRIYEILKQVIRMTYRNYSNKDALPATDYRTFKVPDNSLVSAKENAQHWLAAIDEENARRTTKEGS